MRKIALGKLASETVALILAHVFISIPMKTALSIIRRMQDIFRYTLVRCLRNLITKTAAVFSRKFSDEAKKLSASKYPDGQLM